MVSFWRRYIGLAIFIWLSTAGSAEGHTLLKSIRLEPFGNNMRHWFAIYEERSDFNPVNQPQYSRDEVVKIANNMLLYQRNNGGWPKNYDMRTILSQTQIDSLLATKDGVTTTFDNGSTYTQIEYLAKAYLQTHDERYKAAALKGLNFVLGAQYPNGGWPQYYPLEKGYSRHITYNDGAMIGVMKLLKLIDDRHTAFEFVPEKMRDRVHQALNNGLSCLLNTQIVDCGELTVWCQQHDEVTLKPAWARAYELPVFCSAESASIVEFLMGIDQPSKEIIRSVQAAVKWFLKTQILHTRVETIHLSENDPAYLIKKDDRIVVRDSTAKPIWTRFYEIGSCKPIFSDRNSKILYSLSDVSHERRAGYSWYNYAPQRIIKIYPQWAKRWNVESIVKAD